MYAPNKENAVQSLLRTLFTPKIPQNSAKTTLCPKSPLSHHPHRFAAIWKISWAIFKVYGFYQEKDLGDRSN